MSIINEALKKAQQDLKRTVLPVPVRAETSFEAETPPPASQPASAMFAPSPSKEKGKSWRMVVVWELLSLCVIGAFLFVLQPQIFDILNKRNVPPAAAQPAPVAAPAAAPQTAVIRPIRPNKNAMTLNGIMQIENKWMALINDEIYEEGDYIKNKKIDKISSEGVTLVEGNRTIFLSARHKKTPN